MAEISITEAVSRAEESIETGNYDRAIDLCHRILGEFPDYVTAFRVTGEACLENGDLEEARTAFQRTLERDPQSISAHLGLGKIAEEQDDKSASLAHYQVAWEIDPRRRDLREHVSRLSQQVYGEDGRLYLTRAALASLHFHAGRWDRAVSEAAQVLQEQQGRVDVQIRMAESLWRRGDLPQALQVSGTVLRSLPVAVVPLLIQADSHRQLGNESDAAELIRQARAVDPASDRAADMVMVGQEDQSEFLLGEDVPMIDERALTDPAPSRYVPAPDFMAEEPTQPDPIDQTVAEAPAPAESAPLGDIGGHSPQQEDLVVKPFRWDDIADEDLEMSDIPEDAGGVSPPPDDAVMSPGGESTDDEPPSFELFTDEELENARPSTDRLPGYTGMLQSLEGEGMRPFNPENPDQDLPLEFFDDEPETARETSQPDDDPVIEDSTESDDWSLELPDLDAPASQPEEAAPGDEDPFDLDWGRVDEEIEQAIPGETPRGYTGELRALEEIGVEPFSFGDEDSITADDVADDVDSEPAGPETVPSSDDAELDLSEFESLSSATEADPARSDKESVDPASAWEDIDLDSQLAEEERTTQFGAGDVSDPAVDELFGDYEPTPRAFDSPEAPAEDAGPDMIDDVIPDAGDVPDDESIVVQFDEDIGPADELAQETSRLSPAASHDSMLRLGVEKDLLDRARQAKTDLISAGRIDGTKRLPGLGPDLDALQAAVAAEPDNADMRVALAVALSETEDQNAALDEVRWVYRNAGDRGVDVIESLMRIADQKGSHEQSAHRLAGAFYRRAGDWQAAASHYEESLVPSGGQAGVAGIDG